MRSETIAEIKISPTEGVTARGFISYAVLGVIVFYIYMKYGHGKVKKKINSRKARRKK